jgi:hypothetical protein
MNRGRIISVVELVFLLPATIFLGPTLIYTVFVILPLGVFFSQSFTEALLVIEISSLALLPLLGLVAAWLTKIYGINRIAERATSRWVISTFLLLGVIGGCAMSIRIAMVNENVIGITLFLILPVILPAMLIGAYQLFYLMILRHSALLR